MKHTIKKFAFSMLALIAGFSMIVQTASAAGSFNPQPSPWGTGILSAAIEPTNTIGVSDTATAQPGDIVALNIYYHNNGNATIANAKIKFSPKQTSSGTSFTFTGTLSGDGVATISDTTTVQISSSQTLTFIPGSVRWFPNQSAQTQPGGQNISSSQENDLVGGNGFNIGSLTAGWPSQGGIVAKFQVSGSNTPGPSNNYPTISTYNYSNRNHTTGSVQLNGYYNANGSDTTTWFEYRKNGGSWTSTTEQSHGISNGNIDKVLTNLSTGSYEYRAMARNQYGTATGSIVSFTIDRGDGGCTNDCGCDTCDCTNDCNDGDIAIETKPADDIDEDSALLVGDINDIGSGDVTRWFEWDTNRNDVEDGDGSTLSLSGDTNSEGNFSKTLSGLQSDRTYYFRACAEDDNGDEDCGSVKSFTTDDDNDNGDDDTDSPDITTLSPVSIGSTIATVDGFYDANGCSVTTWFEYGRTSSLGSSTARFNRGNGSGSMMYSFTSLASNTTYYYRAVGTNCEGTTRGAIKNFTTNSGGTVNPPVVITTGGGSGNAFIKLMIDNHRDTVRAGSEIAYDVSWENITTRRLNDLILEINFPDQMIVIDTDRGTITRGGHSVIVEIDELTSRETDDMTVVTEIRTGLREGDPVVAQAIMAFENPTTQATENAIGYDSDEFSARTSGLGASLFGLSFLPGSLAGWLLILLIILVIIVLARHFMAQNQNRVTVNTQPMPTPVAPNNGTNGNDYIVYKTTPRV